MKPMKSMTPRKIKTTKLIDDISERKDDTEYYIRESNLEELYKSREPFLMGHYKGDAVYAAIFTSMEQKYTLDD